MLALTLCGLEEGTRPFTHRSGAEVLKEIPSKMTLKKSNPASRLIVGSNVL